MNSSRCLKGHELRHCDLTLHISELPVFLNASAAREIYSLPLHDALPIFQAAQHLNRALWVGTAIEAPASVEDRKSTRLNSSHLGISYAVFFMTTKMPRTKRTFLSRTRWSAIRFAMV